MLATYTGNRTMLRTMRDIRFAKADYDSVLAIGRELDSGVRSAFPDNKYYLSENWLVMARAYARLAQPESSVALLDRIIAWEKCQDRVPWLRTYVAEAKGLKRNLER